VAFLGSSIAFSIELYSSDNLNGRLIKMRESEFINGNAAAEEHPL